MRIVGLEQHVVDADVVERSKAERVAEERAVDVGSEVATGGVRQLLANAGVGPIVVPDRVEPLQEVRDPSMLLSARQSLSSGNLTGTAADNQSTNAAADCWTNAVEHREPARPPTCSATASSIRRAP